MCIGLVQRPAMHGDLSLASSGPARQRYLAKKCKNMRLHNTETDTLKELVKARQCAAQTRSLAG